MGVMRIRHGWMRAVAGPADNGCLGEKIKVNERICRQNGVFQHLNSTKPQTAVLHKTPESCHERRLENQAPTRPPWCARVKLQVSYVSRAPVTDLVAESDTVKSAIRKRPVEGPVAVRLMGLQGDEQADLSAHGGVSKAVYAYPHEHYVFWQTVRAQAGVAAWGDALAPGSLGENLTLQGLLETDLFVGDQLRLPNCLLAVSQPRLPCFKLNAALGFKHAVAMMSQSGYCGSYLVVLQAGTVTAGDPVQCLPGPREVNIRELFFSRMRRG